MKFDSHAAFKLKGGSLLHKAVESRVIDFTGPPQEIAGELSLAIMETNASMQKILNALPENATILGLAWKMIHGIPTPDPEDPEIRSLDMNKGSIRVVMSAHAPK